MSLQIHFWRHSGLTSNFSWNNGLQFSSFKGNELVLFVVDATKVQTILQEKLVKITKLRMLYLLWVCWKQYSSSYQMSTTHFLWIILWFFSRMDMNYCSIHILTGNIIPLQQRKVRSKESCFEETWQKKMLSNTWLLKTTSSIPNLFVVFIFFFSYHLIRAS